MRPISATYRAPSRKATPLGTFRPLAIWITSGFPPGRGSSAVTVPLRWVPTYTMPFSPSASERAPGTSA